MRVAFVGPMLGTRRGFVPNPAEALAPLLADQGVECRLVSSQPAPLRRAADTALTLSRWSRDLSLAVVVTYSGAAFTQARLAARVLRSRGVPYSLYLKGGDLPNFAEENREVVGRLFRTAQSVIAPSRYLADLSTDLGSAAEVIPNVFPVEDTPFRPRANPAPRLLWLRTFHEIYDPQLAVLTLQALREQGVAATMTMAGSDKGELAATEQVIRSLGLSDLVTIVGFSGPAEKRRLFENHDLFLHTNRIDNTPVSVYEAMAAGLPVVGTDVGGMAAFVDGCARLVPHGDPRAAAEALRSLLDNPPLSERASHAGRRLVERHSKAAVIPLWLSHFKRHGRERKRL